MKENIRIELEETNLKDREEDDDEWDLDKDLRHHVVISEYVSIIAAFLCCLTSIFLAYGYESTAAVALFTGKAI